MKNPEAGKGTEIIEVKPEETLPVTTQQGNWLAAVITEAIKSGSTVETMRELLKMDREYKADIAKAEFIKAMSNFNGDCPIIEKSKEALNNGKVMYKYAPMDEILRTIQPHLKANGLSFAFDVTQDKETLTVTCVVTHIGGHSQSSTFQVPSTGGTSIMSGPQKSASALTFAKRYALCNALGVVSGDEDTDAPKTKEDDLATEDQHIVIDTLATQAGYTKADVVGKFREKYKTAYPTMTKVQAEGVIAGLKATIAKKVPATA